MINKLSRNAMRKKRHLRARNTLVGTPVRPRLNVFRSNKHMYAQIIDDVNGETLVAASTLEKESNQENQSNKEGATFVGETVAKRAQEKDISKVVFDRGGYKYHGRIKALADAARSAGLEF